MLTFDIHFELEKELIRNVALLLRAQSSLRILLVLKVNAGAEKSIQGQIFIYLKKMF